MRIAIVYCSKTGNTQELIMSIYHLFQTHLVEVDVYPISYFPLYTLRDYDGIIVGTYTWGNGEIPLEMMGLYKEFEKQNVHKTVTGIVGTGDRFYPHFCGAIDQFRDMLFVQTDLAVTLKVELSPQLKDVEKCHKFVELFLERIGKKVPVMA